MEDSDGESMRWRWNQTGLGTRTAPIKRGRSRCEDESKQKNGRISKMPTMSKSPYLRDDQRLADVIAAIQALGTYKYYKLDFAGWAKRISGDISQAKHWQTVFEEHPEFFRLDSRREKASLVWRRQHQKLFDVDTEDAISRNHYNQLSEDERERISRSPLTSTELSTLISAATDLHSRAIERTQDRRWWIVGVFTLAGVVIGVLPQLLTS